MFESVKLSNSDKWFVSLSVAFLFLFVCCKSLFVVFLGPSGPNLEVSIAISD